MIAKKYDAEFLLDYNQLAQLWYGSLEYLKRNRIYGLFRLQICS